MNYIARPPQMLLLLLLIAFEIITSAQSDQALIFKCHKFSLGTRRCLSPPLACSQSTTIKSLNIQHCMWSPCIRGLRRHMNPQKGPVVFLWVCMFMHVYLQIEYDRCTLSVKICLDRRGSSTAVIDWYWIVVGDSTGAFTFLLSTNNITGNRIIYYWLTVCVHLRDSRVTESNQNGTMSNPTINWSFVLKD